MHLSMFSPGVGGGDTLGIKQPKQSLPPRNLTDNFGTGAGHLDVSARKPGRNEPTHETMALIDLRKLNFRLLLYFTCANSEGSGETARMQSLARAFAVRLCDKTIISWAGSNYV